MLVGAAVLANLVPGLRMPDAITVEHVVTIALVLILFDGGLHIGLRRFRAAALPIASVGLVGTFLTAGAGAVLLHAAFGLDWYLAVLVATAVAPTDPAVVFSVLGQRQIRGRSGTILEGESGANDPVGIALMASLLAAGALTWQGAGQVATTFALQMVVGAAVGVLGGRGLVWFTRTVPLPNEALYPLRSVFCAFALYGIATIAHGSGFLAVFVAGILVATPAHRTSARWSASTQRSPASGRSWPSSSSGSRSTSPSSLDPTCGSPASCSASALRLSSDRSPPGYVSSRHGSGRTSWTFVLFAGLKGAVPILLGEFLQSGPGPRR